LYYFRYFNFLLGPNRIHISSPNDCVKLKQKQTILRKIKGHYVTQSSLSTHFIYSYSSLTNMSPLGYLTLKSTALCLSYSYSGQPGEYT